MRAASGGRLASAAEWCSSAAAAALRASELSGARVFASVCLYVQFVPAIRPAIGWGWGSCEEALRSAEVRPLAADWPLRCGLQSLLHLEARPLITSFLAVRARRRTLAAAGPFLSPLASESAMLPRPSANPQAPPPIGVGIDTSRYGHYAVFLADDLQPADAELPFAESGPGYARLRQRLERLAQKHTPCAFAVRVDAAGQYADNLLAFLHELAQRGPWPLTVSCGDPQRNKSYRAAIFGSQKSDPVEARAAARYALTERPRSDPPLSLAWRTLRQAASRLQAVVRQRTRLINQLHQLVAVTLHGLGLLKRALSAI